ncbi:hypothetical protein BDY21DRAFT_367059 [Lineolata rhizophorae]|uniref:Protein YOP1 n=1 Tax=Lineolata rhizophorae TaxID=578093 RepID=A0A6A6NPE8_9PEZI|nr:hypothetical protein BDY21DRAFT_367059 [Lineolata rhizophorae]
MFDIVPNFLTLALTLVLPTFAAHRALRTSDPALLAPWLIYFLLISVLHAAESFVSPFLFFVPFYAWFRLLAHIYLLLPGGSDGTSFDPSDPNAARGGSWGATYIYYEHLAPVLTAHENQVDALVSNAHDTAKTYIRLGINEVLNVIRVRIFGMEPIAAPPPSPPPGRGGSYAQTLLSRFSIPAARDGLAAGQIGDWYGVVSGALSGATGAAARYGNTSGDAASSGGSGATGWWTSSAAADRAADELSRSGTLVPPSVGEGPERAGYVAAQVDRLRVLLQAFEREAATMDDGTVGRTPPPSGLSKSRSELEFDTLEGDEDLLAYGSTGGVEQRPRRSKRESSGGWMPWNWNAPPDEIPTRSRADYRDRGYRDREYYDRDYDDREIDRRERARASGFDIGS